MNIDDLTLGQVKQLEKLFSKPTLDDQHHLIGKYVIIRTYSAGVHFGILKSKSGLECVLEEAIRIWKWSGAFTLSQMSMEGVKNPEECKFDMPAKSITLQWIEILECTPEAIRSIKGVKPCSV